MDALETLMADDDRVVRAALDALDAQPALRVDPDLASGTSSYSRFTELRSQIVALSRENTRMRSHATSLNQKRKVTTVCQDALCGLSQEIAGEPIPAAHSNPRKLGPAAQAAR